MDFSKFLSEDLDETAWINASFADLIPRRNTNLSNGVDADTPLTNGSGPSNGEDSDAFYSSVEQRAGTMILKLQMYMNEIGTLVDEHTNQARTFYYRLI